ncbi:hypothetical protein AB0K12_23715 [Nonomuraea sp. NPDC049419]|uniref:hypothetical protein n=1 Tax=Nonomuraea sp. NPDC049419 TaxID=3155772 RepID=UPI00343AA0DC
MASQLASALALLTACQQQAPAVDMAALPSVASPPYICGHIPKRAAELMTGTHEPIVVGFLNEWRNGVGYGTCAAYEPTGERAQLLHVVLDSGGARGQVDEYLKDGGHLLQEIVTRGYGAYITDPERETRVAALVVMGKARLSVELVRGVKGRDNAADLVALVKLIAPRLLAGAASPSPDTKTGG